MVRYVKTPCTTRNLNVDESNGQMPLQGDPFEVEPHLGVLSVGVNELGEMFLHLERVEKQNFDFFSRFKSQAVSQAKFFDTF